MQGIDILDIGTKMRIMEYYYNGIYYTFYKLSLNVFKEKDIPHIIGVCWVSIIEFFWILSFHLAYVGLADILFVMPNISIIVLIVLSLMALNAIFFVRKEKYLEIEESFDSANKQELSRFRIITFLLLSITLITPILLAMAFL